MSDTQITKTTNSSQGSKNQGTVFSGINFGDYTIYILILGLFLFLGLTSKTFFSYRNIYTIFYSVSIEFFAIIGFTYLIIMGEVDLSVGSVYCFSGVMAGYLVTMERMPLVTAVLIALLCSALLGMLTGVIITKLKVNSIMVTLGTMMLIRGLAWIITGEMAGRTFSRSLRGLAREKIGTINVTVIVLIVLVIILEITLRRTTFFKKVFYVGENLESAKIYGINSDRIKIYLFTLSSFTAAIGGIFVASRIGHGDVTTGKGLEFKVLTAAVLGGASLFGGKGSIFKSMIGLVFLATLLNGMIIYKIEPLLQQLAVGIILIISVFIDTRLNRKQAS